MTSEQKILLRENLLKQLAEARPFGVLAARLCVGARMWNFNLAEDEIEAELKIRTKLRRSSRYSRAKGLLRRKPTRWRLNRRRIGRSPPPA